MNQPMARVLTRQAASTPGRPGNPPCRVVKSPFGDSRETRRGDGCIEPTREKIGRGSEKSRLDHGRPVEPRAAARGGPARCNARLRGAHFRRHCAPDAPGRALLTLTDPVDVFVRVFIPEARIGEVSVGEPVTIATDGTDETTTGTVSFIASSAEFTPNTVQTEDQRTTLVFEVRVQVDDPDLIRAGMPADVSFG